ncbi:cyanoexosortase B [Prochlorothrix hollandica]|uniref:cyanoexosortase B n=1 Tax=Prochlorothrix hollandica TaxID=1223 RepID=UPI00334239FD
MLRSAPKYPLGSLAMFSLTLPRFQLKRPTFGPLLALLLAILYLPLLVHWYQGWIFKSINLEHEYFSHGVLGLPLAAFFAWEQRSQWQQLPDRAHPLGSALLGLAAAAYLSPRSDLINLSLPLMLMGLCLWCKGRSGLTLMGFPLVLVALATPTDLPYLLAPYTQPLQVFIAGVAAFVLSLLNVDVELRDMYLFVGGRVVEVAPHCAGLKALLTNFYFCLVGIQLAGVGGDRPKVLTLLAGSMGISVVANIIRNTLLTLFHGTGSDGAFHWLHESWGGDLYWALMVLALLLWFKLVLGFQGMATPDSGRSPPDPPQLGDLDPFAARERWNDGMGHPETDLHNGGDLQNEEVQKGSG